MNASLALGSLFDGIGGFPLAGVRQGFSPVWASEIELFPIEVTKIRFPEMLHVGDITKLKGAEMIPVDVVCGGSPCQDLSVAGKRAGLQGERSGLFMEQIRVIKEMRTHDKAVRRTADAVRPRYMVWENVPGVFSSADGEDFRAVLEETCRIADSTVSVPRPPGGVWLSAGAILGYQFSVAWRIYDAQYWGLAQRRRRIFLVADFGGRTAPEILFKQDSLFGNSAPCEKTRQGAAYCSQAGTGDTSGNPLHTGTADRQSLTQRDVRSRIYESSSVRPFLCGDEDGGHDYVYAEKDNQPVLFENYGIDSRYTGPHEAAPTMSARYGTGGNNVPLISQPAVLSEDECAELPPAETYCIAGNIIDRQDHNGGNGMGFQPDISYTLNTADRHCVFSQQRSDEYVSNDVASTQSARQYKDATDLVCETEIAGVNCRSGTENGDLCGTLQSHPSGGYSLNTLHSVRTGKLIRRLTPLECERLQGFPEHWTDIPGASDSARYKALGNSVAIPCVEHVLRGIAYFLRKSKQEGGIRMYIYPDNLKSKAVLWLWQLRDIGVIGVGLLLSVFALAQLNFLPPIVITALYAFLTIRFDDTSILDFIKYACAFFLTRQQTYKWGYTKQ